MCSSDLRKHPDQQTVEIDTTNILFVVGGAFTDLERQIKLRSQGGIGFGAKLINDNTQSYLSKVKPEDLIKFGLIPEFIGRLPVITTLEQLDEDALIKILTEPKNSLTKQFSKLFEMEEVELDIREDALSEIAKKAIERKTGARGLRSILESILMENWCLLISSFFSGYLAFYFIKMLIISYKFQERSEGADEILIWIPQTRDRKSVV